MAISHNTLPLFLLENRDLHILYFFIIWYLLDFRKYIIL